MIRYALKCGNDHGFESWFQSAEAFDALMRAGHLACPDCGSPEVEKALMAPSVSSLRKGQDRTPATPDLGKPGDDPRARALSALRRKIEKESDYVGLDFAAEARAMHVGERPSRPIHGEARRDEAVKLLEDGVPIAPLPFVPRAKTN